MDETKEPFSPDPLRKMNAYWRAANYLSVGQIYLYYSPLLREPLKTSHVKSTLLGHWAGFGATIGVTFILKQARFERLRISGLSPFNEGSRPGRKPALNRTGKLDVSTW